MRLPRSFRLVGGVLVDPRTRVGVCGANRSAEASAAAVDVLGADQVAETGRGWPHR